MSEPAFNYSMDYRNDEQNVTALIGPPGFAPLPVPEPAPRWTWTVRTTVAALATAASVFVATAGTFGALYFVAGGDRAAAAQSLVEQKSGLADVSDELASAQTDQQQAQQRNSSLTTQNAALSACVDAVQHFLWDNLSDAQQTDAVEVILDVCQ